MSTTTAFIHGTTTGYTYGCRCADCTEAHSAYMSEYHARNPRVPGDYERARDFAAQQRRMQRGLPEGDSRHGTVSGYTKWGCRCDPCREAANAYKRDLRAAQRAKAEQSC